MSEASAPGIFISHTHGDQRIADALSCAVDALFAGQVSVSYSSKRGGDGGIRAGEDWFRWIGRQVRDCRVTLVLLTPASIAKPWLLWETGAVYGAALAEGDGQTTRIRPLLYRVPTGEIPGPLQAANMQILRGDRAADAQQFFAELLEDFTMLKPQQLVQAGQRLAGIVQEYLQAVERALDLAPLTPSEAAIQEWCARFTDLAQQGRASEVGYLQDWLDIAFGREEDDKKRPLDLRIHRLLGQLHLDARQYYKAVEQFTLARQLAPRDIFVLRNLAEAEFKAGNTAAVQGIVQDIERLDSKAFVHNSECAALKGKFLRETGDASGATKVYERALEANPNSYYLADLLGQIRLEHDVPGAQAVYERALAILSSLGELNVWTRATAATAALVTGRTDQLKVHLTAIRQLNPTPREMATIIGGLRDVNAKLPAFQRVDASLFDSVAS